MKPFTDLADAYEAMIDWPKRLANEAPFFRGLFEQVGASSVLDVSCGTGRHANLFHSWGLRVEGADISPAMIERCRHNWGESNSLRWSVRGFDEPVPAPGSFDVAICTGNSLALAGDMKTVSLAISTMLAAVRTGGAIIIHVLNLWRLAEGVCLWQKCQRAELPSGMSLIIKGVHRGGATGYVDMLVTNLSSDPPALNSDCVPFLGLDSSQLEKSALQSGAAAAEFFGGYDRKPYDRPTSQDLIMVARAGSDPRADPLSILETVP